MATRPTIMTEASSIIAPDLRPSFRSRQTTTITTKIESTYTALAFRQKLYTRVALCCRANLSGNFQLTCMYAPLPPTHRWRVYCRAMASSSSLANCVTSNFVNGWDGTLDYNAPSHRIITGLESCKRCHIYHLKHILAAIWGPCFRPDTPSLSLSHTTLYSGPDRPAS